MLFGGCCGVVCCVLCVVYCVFWVLDVLDVVWFIVGLFLVSCSVGCLVRVVLGAL